MYRKTWLEVDLDAIAENVRIIKKIYGRKFIAVLKADAYGCGDAQVAQAVQDAGADMIAVSSTDEAVMLRNKGCHGEILIVGGIDPSDAGVLKQYDISVPAFSLDFVRQLTKQEVTGLKVHIKVDTGMNRIGFRDIEEMKEAKKMLLAAGCRLEGIFTHFACADTSQEMTDRQYEEFEKAVRALDYPFKWIHCDNSDAAVSFAAPISNACRVGISLYGMSAFCKELKPALALYTSVTMFKHVPAGATIGYGATYTATGDEMICTLPIGYADGFIRANSGRHVYLDGIEGTVVGRVCMDQCMVRVDREVQPGTVVEIFGPHIPLTVMADELHTIPHEIMTLISPRVTRVYRYHGQVIGEANLRLAGSRN